ncbi:MAG: alpha-glucan family phosphorylase [Chloroflexi bacterium]|nr:alpha-glucan family phosphorylase [Chloroflexota bacterium]
MEVAVNPAIPTYSGGLGMLAGDSLRAAADLSIPMVGISLLHRKGYFRQHLDAWGNQSESPAVWSPEDLLHPLPNRASVSIEGRDVQIRAWRYLIRGLSGHAIPIYFLDTALPENSPWDQTLTDNLYGGDDHYRFCQEVILGLGGYAMLREIGCAEVYTYHMNEGHSALLSLALLEERHRTNGLKQVTVADREAVRQRCVFTTHTPVPAGIDKFPYYMVRGVLGEEPTAVLNSIECFYEGSLNMTNLALLFSRYINGVSMRHEEISRGMFPNYPISSITNGVHALTWTSQPFQQLFDRHIPQWCRDNLYLRYAISIPLDEIKEAHAQSKQRLLAEVQKRTGVALSPQAMTMGFARRAAEYKRADLLFSDLERLKRIASQVGPIQIIYGGKAHPRDEGGKEAIRRVFQAAAALGDAVPVLYLEEYDMALAKHLCAGVDLWLNTPLKPDEASGTSGMKASLNGVPSLSVLDGWWVEGHVEGFTGWSVGNAWGSESDPSKEIASLYDKLEYVILPMFYERPQAYAEVMRSSIALNGSFYNAQRMMFQYMENAYQAEKPERAGYAAPTCALAQEEAPLAG